jgi:hypothetical protein
MAALGADLSGQRRTIRVFQCPIAKPYSRRPAKQPWLAEGAADPGGETRVLRFIPSVEWNQWAISTVLAVEYDDGGVADENHTWMCGARARFLNRDDSSPGEGLHQRRLDWRHSRALCRPSRLIGSCRRLRGRPPRSKPPKTIKAAAAERATEHGSLMSRTAAGGLCR